MLVSPLDWSLIETWKDQGIPLHIVLRGIDRSFENAEKSGRKTPPTTLSYCHGAVMEAFSEFQESRIGKSPDQEDQTEFSEGEKSRVIGLLERLQSGLREVEEGADIGSAGDRIHELKSELQQADVWNAAEVDRELGAVAQDLVATFREQLDQEILKKIEDEIRSSLKVYRKRVSKEIYGQLFEKQLRQRILELFGLPDFTLLNL